MRMIINGQSPTTAPRNKPPPPTPGSKPPRSPPGTVPTAPAPFPPASSPRTSATPAASHNSEFACATRNPYLISIARDLHQLFHLIKCLQSVTAGVVGRTFLCASLQSVTAGDVTSPDCRGSQGGTPLCICDLNRKHFPTPAFSTSNPATFFNFKNHSNFFNSPSNRSPKSVVKTPANTTIIKS